MSSVTLVFTLFYFDMNNLPKKTKSTECFDYVIIIILFRLCSNVCHSIQYMSIVLSLIHFFFQTYSYLYYISFICNVMNFIQNNTKCQLSKNLY